MKWEYMQVQFVLPKFAGESMNLAGVLKDYGVEGWEVCGLMRLPNATGLVLLKRPVKTQETKGRDARRA